jgi:hypothetical protein
MIALKRSAVAVVEAPACPTCNEPGLHADCAVIARQRKAIGAVRFQLEYAAAPRTAAKVARTDDELLPDLLGRLQTVVAVALTQAREAGRRRDLRAVSDALAEALTAFGGVRS